MLSRVVEACKITPGSVPLRRMNPNQSGVSEMIKYAAVFFSNVQNKTHGRDGRVFCSVSSTVAQIDVLLPSESFLGQSARGQRALSAPRWSR